MLGQPVSMLIPQVVGFRLTGELPEGATATDLVLTVTQMLRERGVVGKFVEFFGPGLAEPAAGRPRDDRQHVAGVRRDVRDLPGRRRDAALPRVHRPPAGAGRAGRGLLPRAGPVPRARTPRTPSSPTRSSSTSATWSRAWPGPSARRTAWRSPTRRGLPRRSCADFVERRRAYQGWRRVRRRDASRPATRPRATAAASAPQASPRTRGDGGAAVAERASARGARPRRGRDRRDHELHEHLEPVGHARRRPAGQEGGRGGPDAQAVGQDEPRARLEGRHRVPRARRADRAARAARLLPRRLRLHDLHRQLGPAAGGDLARDRRARPGGLLGAVGQPQLRGPHPPRGEDELPRLAAAVRGLRAGRPDGRRHLEEPLQGDVYLRDIWPSQEEVNADDRAGGGVRHVPQQLRRGVRGRRELERARGPRGRPLRVGRRSPPTSSARRTSTAWRPSPPRASSQIKGARAIALLGDSVTTDHISPAGAIKEDSPAGALPAASTASSGATSTPTAPGAATTR